MLLETDDTFNDLYDAAMSSITGLFSAGHSDLEAIKKLAQIRKIWNQAHTGMMMINGDEADPGSDYLFRKSLEKTLREDVGPPSGRDCP